MKLLNVESVNALMFYPIYHLSITILQSEGSLRIQGKHSRVSSAPPKLKNELTQLKSKPPELRSGTQQLSVDWTSMALEWVYIVPETRCVLRDLIF